MRDKKKIHEYNKRYYKRNKNKMLSYQKEYYDKNKDKIKLQVSEYQKNNRTKINKRNQSYRSNKRKNEPLYKLTHNMRGRIRSIFKAKKKGKTQKSKVMLGAPYSEVKRYVENKFKKGMTWENYGEWHIDHIIPLSSAKTEEEIIMLCHYTNLQPLWAEENLKKGNKNLTKKQLQLRLVI